ncbi:hypothetical protein P171DRAFT_489834 [Karstenula rhodostoma CBS 690.94]|uniref:Uncharacterized protein n=1 Tax=Karstenula rhodostoma CBS 690.94 TaxID=1392251 RepID=A0A9P4PBB3_9PLEO|nr:hypothetical protein P171DRAFT_489834 [Karstenula rhodostoma CBS 690.94]
MAYCETASINFLRRDPLYATEKPFQVFTGDDIATQGQRNTNLLWEERNVQVEDFRDEGDYFDIDNHGFTSRTIEGFSRLDSTTEIELSYIPTIQDLIRNEIADAGTVFVYDWRIRDSSTYYPEGRVNFGDQSKSLLPSNFAHVGKSHGTGVHCETHSAKFYKEFKQSNSPVDQWALAVCDANTFESSELMETDSVRGGNVTTLYYAHYNPNQKWHFLHQQTPKEALIFKHFDSKTVVKSSRAIHASIQHQKVVPDAKPRRSIEVKVLVFAGSFESSIQESG